MKKPFIYFDVGNTLFNVTDWMSDLANRHQKLYQDFRNIFDQYHETLCKGGMSLADLWPIYVKTFSLPKESFDLERFWLDHCLPIPQMHELVKIVAQQYRIGLLTNIYKGLLEKCIEEERIPRVSYASIIDSADVGFKKPEEKIYEIAEEKASVPPNDILYTDNKEASLVPAQTRGWHTILFHPDAVSKSIDEIQTFLTKQF